MENLIIGNDDIARCPIRSRLASHYFRHRDGLACLCELDGALEIAERYANTRVGSPFTPPARKAEARAFAIEAWLDGFRAARDGERT
jgi:hypothetical protein